MHVPFEMPFLHVSKQFFLLLFQMKLIRGAIVIIMSESQKNKAKDS